MLHWTTGVSFEILLAVAFALGALAAPYFAAQKVIVPELIDEGFPIPWLSVSYHFGPSRSREARRGPEMGGLDRARRAAR